MKTRLYLFVFFCLTLFSLGFFILILSNINPFDSDILTISMFFVSLFIFITGILTLIGFYIRVRVSNNEIFFANFKPSLRQATLFSLALIGILIFQSLKVLTWWDALMLTLSILLIELYFQNKNTIPKNNE